MLSPADVKAYVIMTLKGLEFLHSHWILHRVSVCVCVCVCVCVHGHVRSSITNTQDAGQICCEMSSSESPVVWHEIVNHRYFNAFHMLAL